MVSPGDTIKLGSAKETEISEFRGPGMATSERELARHRQCLASESAEERETCLS